MATRSEILRKSIRREFELHRCEDDPIVVMKMMMNTREALQQTK